MASNSVRAPDFAKYKRGWWLKILVWYLYVRMLCVHACVCISLLGNLM